jgi:tRNA-specific 2-thiouridylase
LGVDFIATGHYARIKNLKLLIAKDKEKDQSYFLYNLSQKQLKKILFPTGNYTKSKVKKLAKNFEIADLVRPESRDICFLKGRHQDFLKKYLKLKPGLTLNTFGKKIGQHQGLPLYTIGQRKEIEVAGALPYYVLKLDFQNNTLIVTDNEKDLYKKELVAEKVNWVSGKKPKLPLKIKAKIRYLHPASSAIIYPKIQNTNYKLLFNWPQRAITPGQSVVFYRGQEVIGGGIIR